MLRKIKLPRIREKKALEPLISMILSTGNYNFAQANIAKFVNGVKKKCLGLIIKTIFQILDCSG